MSFEANVLPLPMTSQLLWRRQYAKYVELRALFELTFSFYWSTTRISAVLSFSNLSCTFVKCTKWYQIATNTLPTEQVAANHFRICVDNFFSGMYGKRSNTFRKIRQTVLAIRRPTITILSHPAVSVLHSSQMILFTFCFWNIQRCLVFPKKIQIVTIQDLS